MTDWSEQVAQGRQTEDKRETQRNWLVRETAEGERVSERMESLRKQKVKEGSLLVSEFASTGEYVLETLVGSQVWSRKQVPTLACATH